MRCNIKQIGVDSEHRRVESSFWSKVEHAGQMSSMTKEIAEHARPKATSSTCRRMRTTRQKDGEKLLDAFCTGALLDWGCSDVKQPFKQGERISKKQKNAMKTGHQEALPTRVNSKRREYVQESEFEVREKQKQSVVFV